VIWVQDIYLAQAANTERGESFFLKHSTAFICLAFLAACACSILITQPQMSMQSAPAKSEDEG